MSQLIPQVDFLDKRRLLPSQGLSNSVKVIVTSLSEEILENPITGFQTHRSIPPVSPSFEVSINLSSHSHDHIARLLRDQFVCYHQFCNYLASQISRVAFDLGFGFNGFTITLSLTVTAITYRRTLERSLSTLLQQGRINTQELKGFETEPCSICLDSLYRPNPDTLSVTRMTCSHLFHHHCLSGWLQRKNTCPLCRTVLYESNAKKS